MTKQEIIQDESKFQRACDLWVRRNIGECVSSLMSDVRRNLEDCAEIFDFDYEEAFGWFSVPNYEAAVDDFIDDADLDDLETIADIVGYWSEVLEEVGYDPNEDEELDGPTKEQYAQIRTKVKALITENSEYQEIAQHFNLDYDYDEVYEHWTIPEGWTARELRDEGQVVFDFGGLTIWGRMTTGQSISMDYVISKIVKKLSDDHWIWNEVK